MPDPGQPVCWPAGLGYYVANEASTSQELCDKGYVSGELGSSFCVPCQPGSYQPELGQSECIQASPGNFVNETGAKKQKKCDEGYVARNYANTDWPWVVKTLQNFEKFREISRNFDDQRNDEPVFSLFVFFFQLFFFFEKN